MPKLELILLALGSWKAFRFKGKLKDLVNDVINEMREDVLIFKENSMGRRDLKIEDLYNVSDGIIYTAFGRVTIDLKDVKIHVDRRNYTTWIETRKEIDEA